MIKLGKIKDKYQARYDVDYNRWVVYKDAGGGCVTIYSICATEQEATEFCAGINRWETL